MPGNTQGLSGKTDPGAPARQQIYLKALATLPEVEVHYGRFLAKTVWRPIVNLPVAGRRIETPRPVMLPEGDHPVTDGRPQTLPVGVYPGASGVRDVGPGNASPVRVDHRHVGVVAGPRDRGEAGMDVLYRGVSHAGHDHGPDEKGLQCVVGARVFGHRDWPSRVSVWERERHWWPLRQDRCAS